nr:hypothetical protein [Tanacetum cinerariifolium]
MMSFLTSVVASRYPPTNNQLRTSSNPRSGGTSGKQRVVVCYNCKGEGHMSKQCIKPRRKRDAEWFKDKVLLVQAQANGQVNQDNKKVNELLTAELERYQNQERVLNELKHDEKVSTSYESSQEIESLKHTLSKYLKEKESLEQKITILKNDFQKEESRNIDRELALDKQVKELNNIVFKRNQSAQTVHMLKKPQVFYNHATRQALGFQNPCYLKKAQKLKPNLYDGSVIRKSDVVMTESSAEQAFWSQYSVQTDEPNLFGTTIVEVPKELPKVSLVNSCLKKLKFHLASFDIVVKERTTATAITEGTWGFEHTKACFRDDIIPFVKNLKELFTSFDQCLIDEVTEVQNAFKQMDLAVEQHYVEKTKFQTKMENVLQENDRLLTQALSVEIVNIVVHDYVNFDCLNEDACAHCVDVAPLVPKLCKNRTAHTDYIRHTQEEAATLREIVESERLLSPLNTSLDYALVVTPKNKTKQIRRTAQITKSERTNVATSPLANIDSNTPVLSSTGVTLVSSASGSKSQDNTKKNRIR